GHREGESDGVPGRDRGRSEERRVGKECSQELQRGRGGVGSVVGGGDVGGVVHRGGAGRGRGGGRGDVHGVGGPTGQVRGAAAQGAPGDGAGGVGGVGPPVDGPGGPGVGGQGVVQGHVAGDPVPVVGHREGESDGVPGRDRGVVGGLGHGDGRPQDPPRGRGGVGFGGGGGGVGGVVHRGG